MAPGTVTFTLPDSRANLLYSVTGSTVETPAPAPTPTHARCSLLSHPRRFPPSSHLPSLQIRASPSHNSPVLATNVAEPLQKDPSPPLRPDVNSMPSSVAYSETRTLASEHGRALNATPRLGADRKASNMDDGRSKAEDVFLNIARTDSGRRNSLGRSEFRRSRLGYSSQDLRSPTSRVDSEQTPSPDQHLSNADSPLLSQDGSPTIPYSTVPHSPAASAHPLDDSNRFRFSSLTTGARSAIGAPRSRLTRTSPETSPRSPAVNGERRASLHESRLHRHSALSTIRSSRQPSTSEVTERARGDTEKTRADGTESTLSTTAPSTVWDELDDLKSRIRKLELTGKLPPSSQAAISGASHERPRTAATTVTALSTSPEHHRKASIPSAETDNAYQSQVQPLLQSALAKAKAVLSNDVYSTLEATIMDALALSTILGVNTIPSGSVSVVNGGYSPSDRQARRKADSVCRSLTELCLALTDEELKRKRSQLTPSGGAQAQGTNGNEVDSLTPGSAFQRSASHEPERAERRLSTSRIASRLEARRASLVNTIPGSTAETRPAQSPSNVPTPPSRLHRISTSLRSHRLPADEEKTEGNIPLSRSLSRAMTLTDVGTPSPVQSVSPGQRFSYGHSRSVTSAQPEQGLCLTPNSPHHQLSTPSQPAASQPRTPTTESQTSIPFRRSYIAPAVYSPAMSRSNIQAGSRRYGLSPGAEGSARSFQVEPSQTRISAPGAKSITSYTPIQQPRLRTNSLGTRRFGLRNRLAGTTDDPVNLDDSID